MLIGIQATEIHQDTLLVLKEAIAMNQNLL